jgi:hypothetical protein
MITYMRGNVHGINKNEIKNSKKKLCKNKVHIKLPFQFTKNQNLLNRKKKYMK